jgi:hypothetical protein
MNRGYQAVIWSGVEVRLLRALWEITAEDGGIPVQLGYEPDNPADSQAVMITLNTWSLRRLLGADLARVPERTEYWRLGYISRAAPGRDELWQSLQARDDLLDARLKLEGHDWLVRVFEADPNDPDMEIPF